MKLDTLLIQPVHSILKQSYDSRERKEPLNGDGFGIGWYDYRIDHLPAVFKEITPAWSNQNLLEISGKLISGSVFAHVRAATDGLDVNEFNCHPFKSGHYLWMHNGRINGFHKIKRKMLDHIKDEYFNRIKGNTDSEYTFAVFLSILDGLDEDLALLTRLELALLTTIETIHNLTISFEGYSTLNFALTDGCRFLFSRFTDNHSKLPPTLYFTRGSELVIDNGHMHIKDPQGNQFYMVASEAVDFQNDLWRAIPPNHILSINQDHEHKIIPVILNEHARLDPI